MFFYISPQVWAWKEQRFHKIKKYIDELIVIFPFEVDWFKKRGVDVQYFGHPLIDVTPSLQLKKQVDKYITIGLFPGSRKQEIKKHLPNFYFSEAEIGEDVDKRDYLVSNEKIEATGFKTENSLSFGIEELIKGFQIIKKSEYANI